MTIVPTAGPAHPLSVVGLRAVQLQPGRAPLDVITGIAHPPRRIGTVEGGGACHCDEVAPMDLVLAVRLLEQALAGGV